jgi:hypothetical protein
MPADQYFRSDDRNGLQSDGAEAIEPDECQPICVGQPQALRCPPAQNVELMTKNEIIGFEPVSRLQQRCQPI